MGVIFQFGWRIGLVFTVHYSFSWLCLLCVGSLSIREMINSFSMLRREKWCSISDVTSDSNSDFESESLSCTLDHPSCDTRKFKVFLSYFRFSWDGRRWFIVFCPPTPLTSVPSNSTSEHYTRCLGERLSFLEYTVWYCRQNKEKQNDHAMRNWYEESEEMVSSRYLLLSCPLSENLCDYQWMREAAVMSSYQEFLVIYTLSSEEGGGKSVEETDISFLQLTLL